MPSGYTPSRISPNLSTMTSYKIDKAVSQASDSHQKMLSPCSPSLTSRSGLVSFLGRSIVASLWSQPGWHCCNHSKLGIWCCPALWGPFHPTIVDPALHMLARSCHKVEMIYTGHLCQCLLQEPVCTARASVLWLWGRRQLWQGPLSCRVAWFVVMSTWRIGLMCCCLRCSPSVRPAWGEFCHCWRCSCVDAATVLSVCSVALVLCCRNSMLPSDSMISLSRAWS